MIEKIFLLNHPDFSKRREYITNRLNIENIDYTIVDNYSPSEIDHEELTKNWYIYKNIIIEQVGRYSYYNNPKKISPGSLSLVLKHLHCWKEQVSKGYSHIMILEDDCEIPDNFRVLLNRVEQDSDFESFDLIMLGGFSDFISPNIIEDRFLHYHPLQKTRCTHGYIINKKFVDILIDGFSNINNPIDIKINEVLQLNNAKVAWIEPGLKQISF